MKKITSFRHPQYYSSVSDWQKWRLTYEGGEPFRRYYLKRFTNRETEEDFRKRRDRTPIPSFAKAAIHDIRNSLFQRMNDIVRKGGSPSYHQAVSGGDLGVDRCGSSMNAFIGRTILDELLVMGRVGIFVDAPEVPSGLTLADQGKFRPYLYKYPVERILSYSQLNPDLPGEITAILLEDQVLQYDQVSGLPEKEVVRYRHLWKDNEGVWCQFYDAESNPIDRFGNPSGKTQLLLPRIPFVLLDTGQSLLVDACEYQIALLNLISSDVNYAILANFPFYTEQRDMRDVGSHLKSGVNPDGTATTGGQGGHDNEIKAGVTQGRYYPKDMDRPQFIHPSPDPLHASMELQDRMEAGIRKLVNLAVQTLASRESAESKELDNAGLEAGLSYIGLVLESAERQIADLWAAYEQIHPNLRQIATVKYPDRYSLKNDGQRIEEADQLATVIQKTPSRTARKELWKLNTSLLLGGRVDPDTIGRINREIDAAGYTTSDPDIIIEAKNAGLVGEQLASIALGFPDDEYMTARLDHTARIKRIAEAQGASESPQARGVDDMSENPNEGKDEKEASRDNTMRDNTEDRTRGEAK